MSVYGDDGVARTGLTFSFPFPLSVAPDPSDIVWPEPNWPTDENGRGLTLLEMEHLTLTENAA